MGDAVSGAEQGQAEVRIRAKHTTGLAMLMNLSQSVPLLPKAAPNSPSQYRLSSRRGGEAREPVIQSPSDYRDAPLSLGCCHIKDARTNSTRPPDAWFRWRNKTRPSLSQRIGIDGRAGG